MPRRRLNTLASRTNRARRTITGSARPPASPERRLARAVRARTGGR
jgi:hypothetical protein